MVGRQTPTREERHVMGLVARVDLEGAVEEEVEGRRRPFAPLRIDIDMDIDMQVAREGGIGVGEPLLGGGGR